MTPMVMATTAGGLRLHGDFHPRHRVKRQCHRIRNQQGAPGKNSRPSRKAKAIKAAMMAV